LLTFFGVLFFSAFSVALAYLVVEAFLTGRAKFPARWSESYVTWDSHPGWFLASVVITAMMAVLMGHTAMKAWNRYRSLRRR
jgi:anti-sigma-K factor RskA